MAKTDVRRTATGHRPPQFSASITTALRAAFDKKAQQVTVMDLRGSQAFTDTFVICSGQTSRQVKAIVESIEDALRKEQVRPSHVEGLERAEWVLLDYFDFVVHVFTPDTRAFYGLERLWGSAELVEVVEEDVD
jgi:ribosome-associated protein